MELVISYTVLILDIIIVIPYSQTVLWYVIYTSARVYFLLQYSNTTTYN